MAVSRPGDVWAIGSHPLICGDATDRAVVAALMQGDTAPVLHLAALRQPARLHLGRHTDWDGLMRGVFAHLPMAGDGQVLVGLGLIHRDNEVRSRIGTWLAGCASQGWRRFAWYVWDQGPGMPGDWAGRFAPSFEFVFHFQPRSSRNRTRSSPASTPGRNPPARRWLVHGDAR